MSSRGVGVERFDRLAREAVEDIVSRALEQHVSGNSGGKAKELASDSQLHRVTNLLEQEGVAELGKLANHQKDKEKASAPVFWEMVSTIVDCRESALDEFLRVVDQSGYTWEQVAPRFFSLLVTEIKYQQSADLRGKSRRR